MLLVAAAAVCWSSGGLIARLVATDPWTTTLWRCAFSATFLLAIGSLLGRGGAVKQWRRIGVPGVGVAACLAIASTCFILSLAHTSVANTLMLMAIGPYVAGVLGWLILGERVRLRTWATMAVALAGVAVMVSDSYGRGRVTGDALAIVTASAFALATVLVRRHPEIQMTPAAALAAVFAALGALPVATPLGTSARDVGLLALFGVGQFGVGFLLFTRGARLIAVAETSLIGMLEIVLGPMWVWLLLGEHPGVTALLGGAVIVSALLVHALLELAAPGRPERRVATPAAETP
jgi:drug/metabolite transporter (DMT)-like permease